MFRANRIGTPYIHTDQITANASATAWNVGAISGSLGGNWMSSTPLGNFDRMELRWDGAAKTIGVNEKSALLAPVLIQKPLNGDTVGVEYNLSMITDDLSQCIVMPVLMRPTTAPASVWTAFNTGGRSFTPLIDGPVSTHNALGTQGVAFGARGQVLVRNVAAGDPSGVIGVGFLVYNMSAAVASLTHLEFMCSIRQDLDQVNVGYVDTRR